MHFRALGLIAVHGGDRNEKTLDFSESHRVNSHSAVVALRAPLARPSIIVKNPTAAWTQAFYSSLDVGIFLKNAF